MRSLAGIRQYADVICVGLRTTCSWTFAIGDRDPVSGCGTIRFQTMLVAKRCDELRIAHHHSSPHVELSAQPEALRSSARGNASRCSEWLLMGKLGVDLDRLLVAVNCRNRQPRRSRPAIEWVKKYYVSQ